MNPPSKLLTRSFLVGVLIVGTAYGASALTVKRTNQLIDGVYVPVLIVKVDGQTHVHAMGDDGLTRSILFNRGRALAWAKAKYGAEASDLDGDDDGRSGDDDDNTSANGDDDDDDDGAYT